MKKKWYKWADVPKGRRKHYHKLAKAMPLLPQRLDDEGFLICPECFARAKFFNHKNVYTASNSLQCYNDHLIDLPDDYLQKDDKLYRRGWSIERLDLNLKWGITAIGRVWWTLTYD